MTKLLGTFYHKSISSISYVLDDYGLDLILPVVFLFIAIAAGIFFGNIYISLALVVILEWILVFMIPTIMTTSIAVVITIFTGLMLWGGSRR